MFEITTEKEVMEKEISDFLKNKQETKLLKYFESSDFGRAPASTVFHGNFECGLLFHSYHVGKVAAKISEALGLESPVANYTPVEFGFLLGLVHDLCKVDFYESYQKNVKNEQTGSWEKVPAYRVRSDNHVYGHGVTSVFRLQALVQDSALMKALTYPVLYHMGSYDVSEQEKYGYAKAQSDFPWLSVLQSADQIAAYVYGY